MSITLPDTKLQSDSCQFSCSLQFQILKLDGLQLNETENDSFIQQFNSDNKLSKRSKDMFDKSKTNFDENLNDELITSSTDLSTKENHQVITHHNNNNLLKDEPKLPPQQSQIFYLLTFCHPLNQNEICQSKLINNNNKSELFNYIMNLSEIQKEYFISYICENYLVINLYQKVNQKLLNTRIIKEKKKFKEKETESIVKLNNNNNDSNNNNSQSKSRPESKQSKQPMSNSKLKLLKNEINENDNLIDLNQCILLGKFEIDLRQLLVQNKNDDPFDYWYSINSLQNSDLVNINNIKLRFRVNVNSQTHTLLTELEQHKFNQIKITHLTAHSLPNDIITPLMLQDDHKTIK